MKEYIMTKNLSRNQIIDLYQTLAPKSVETFNPKFSFFLLRNIKYLEEEVKVIDEMNLKLREVLKEYDAERNECITNLSDKDEDGKPIFLNNGQSVKMETNQEKFNTAIKELNVKYKDSLEEYTKVANDVDELLKEEIEQKILKISYFDIPSEEFTVEQLTKLAPFIKESEEELDELIMG